MKVCKIRVPRKKECVQKYVKSRMQQNNIGSKVTLDIVVY